MLLSERQSMRHKVLQLLHKLFKSWVISMTHKAWFFWSLAGKFIRWTFSYLLADGKKKNPLILRSDDLSFSTIMNVWALRHILLWLFFYLVFYFSWWECGQWHYMWDTYQRVQWDTVIAHQRQSEKHQDDLLSACCLSVETEVQRCCRLLTSLNKPRLEK